MGLIAISAVGMLGTDRIPLIRNGLDHSNSAVGQREWEDAIKNYPDAVTGGCQSLASRCNLARNSSLTFSGLFLGVEKHAQASPCRVLH